MRSVGAILVKLIATATSGLVSFTTNVIRPVKVTCEFSPVQEGTGDPSPDNVRPISGWTGCEIGHSGENLITNYLHANVNSSGKVVSHDTYDIALAPVQSGQKYKIAGETSDSASGVYAFFRTKPAINSTSYNGERTVYNIENTDIITAPITGWIAVRTMKNVRTVSIEKAELLTISWQTEAGTVYGGTVTLNEDGSADVVETYGQFVLNGNNSFAKQGSTGWYTTIHPFALTGGKNSISYCDSLKKINQQTSTAFGITFGYSGANRIIITGSQADYSTSAKLNAYFSSHPATCVSVLATPQTYHFSDIGQLQSFLDTNNIWHNMNGGITVEYWNKQ